MADERLEVLLKARIDPTSQKDLQVQATAVGEKLEPIDLDIRIDTRKAIQSFSELKKVMKEVTSLAKQNEDGILGDAVDIQTIEKFKNAFGKTVTIIDQLIQKTDEFGNQTNEVATEITKNNTSLEKQNQLIDKASKLQTELNLARQKFDITGQADLYKLGDNLDLNGVENLRSRFKNIDINPDGSNLDEVLNNIKSINKEYDLIIKDANLNKKINDDIAKQNADIVKQKEKELKLYQEIKTILDKLPSSAVGTNNAQDLYSLLDSTTEIKDLQALKDMAKQYYNESITSEKELTNVQKLKNQGIKETFNDYKRIQDISTKVDKGLADLNSVKTSYSGANVQDFEKLENAWKDIRTQIQNGTIDYEEANSSIKKLINSNKDFETSAKKASIATNSLGDRLKKAFQYFTFYDALQMGKRAVESMVETIFDLDDALVELRKVSDLSGQSLQDFTRQAYNLGTEISKSGSEVIKASTAFAKAGFADSELLNLAESALILTSIGDGLTDASKSAETLISVMKGFGKSTSEIPKIMDAINNVSNNASVNFSDVTMALQRMAGVMNASNITMERSVGMFTAINEVLRNTEMTSTSLNSISMRMRGLSEDGEAIDGLVPKLQKMYKTIAGIDMTDANGQLKNMYDIAGELAPKWDTLTENQKQFIASESAGLRQSKSFLIMMDNYDRVLEATALAYDSAGSAQQEFIKWQDSLEGRMNNLKSSVEQFASETINSSFIKSIISATTELVKFGTAVGGATPLIISLGLAFLTFQKGNLISTLFTGIITQIKILTTTTIGAVGAVTALQMALGVGFAIAGILGVSYAINSISEKANKAKESVNTLSGELKELQTQSKSVNELSIRFMDLKKISDVDKTSEQLQEFYDIQAQLKELIPDLNGHIDEQGNFIISEEENVRSLSDAYKILIDDKRKALADTSKESAKYTLDDYNKQKDRINLINDYGQQYLELAQKAEQGKLNTTDLDQVNYLQTLLGIPFKTADIKKAFSEAQSAIKQSLSDMQTNIRNQLVGSDEWETIGKDLSDSLLKGLSDVDEKTLSVLLSGLDNGTISIEEIIKGLKKLSEESNKTAPALTNQKTEFAKLQEAYSSGAISLSEYTEELQKLNKENEYYKREINDLSIIQEYLNGVLEKVTSNQSLSKDEVEKLVNLYPELENAIYETVDGWSVENDTISLLITTVGTFKNAYITAQNAISLALKNQSVQRLGITLAELEGIQSIADAYNLIGRKLGTSTADARKEQLMAKNGRLSEFSDIFDIGKAKDDIKKMQEDILKGFNPSALSDSVKSSADKVISEIDRLKQELDALLQDKEFDISLIEFSGEDISKQISVYQQMQDAVHNLAQKYRAMGLSENDDYIQQLRTQWMDYASTISSLEATSFDNSNKDIDRTITQLELQQQLLKENSQEYIDIENKKYDEVVKREQLLQNEIARLQAIGTAQAKEQAESLIDSYYDAVAQRYNIIKNLQSAQISIYNEQISELEKQKSALEDLHSFTMQMIKDELNAKKKSIQDELKGIEAVFDAKKKALRDEKDSRNYDKGLTEKSSLVADLENQLAIIKNDETAVAKRKALEEELFKAKEDLADYQYDHSIDLAEKALDTELELQKSKLEEEISELDDTLSNEVTMRELANKRIEKSGEKLKNQLISHAKEYGTFTIEEVTSAWEIAGSAVDDFDTKQQNLLETLKRITEELAKIEGMNISEYANSNGLSTSTKLSASETKAKMMANSAKWIQSDTKTRGDLERNNQDLGNSMGWTYDSVKGQWFYDKQKKLPVYHDGGVVGGSNYATKSTEELAKLLKGELVITPPQADKVMDMITNNSNSNVSISMPIVIEGNADSDTVKALEKQMGKIADTVIDKLNTARNNTGFKKKPKFV